MLNENFIEIFNELLIDHGLNRKQFAERCGIPYTTVIGWTTLNRLPDYASLIKIADFFDCSLDYVTGRKREYEVDGSNLHSAQQKELLTCFASLDGDGRELVMRLVKKLGDNKRSE
ncbi:MAG: helix-turn-helix domain-containing protein [Clostridiales bacterium]|nr:helix-turn-helix domain-containing protein [Clostridiales bacterium]